MAKKSFLELEDLTRWIIAEKAQGQLQDSPDIRIAINDEVTALYNDIVQAWEDYYLKSARTQILSGIDRYMLDVLPKGFSKLRYVEREVSNGTKYPIWPMNLVQKEMYDLASTSTGIPERFFLKGQALHLRWIPNSTGDWLRIYYICLPVPMVVDTDVSIIPEEHNEIIAWGAAIRCFIREGEQTGTLEKQYNRLHIKLINAVEERQAMTPRMVMDYELNSDEGYIGEYF